MSCQLVQQSGYDTNQELYIKIFDKKYTEKMLNEKKWLHTSILGQYSPQDTSMYHDATFSENIEDSIRFPLNELIAIR